MYPCIRYKPLRQMYLIFLERVFLVFSNKIFLLYRCVSMEFSVEYNFYFVSFELIDRKPILVGCNKTFLDQYKITSFCYFLLFNSFKFFYPYFIVRIQTLRKNFKITNLKVLKTVCITTCAACGCVVRGGEWTWT